MLEENMLVE